jgi:hypothetical protein
VERGRKRQCRLRRHRRRSEIASIAIGADQACTMEHRAAIGCVLEDGGLRTCWHLAGKLRPPLMPVRRRLEGSARPQQNRFIARTRCNLKADWQTVAAEAARQAERRNARGGPRPREARERHADTDDVCGIPCSRGQNTGTGRCDQIGGRREKFIHPFPPDLEPAQASRIVDRGRREPKLQSFANGAAKEFRPRAEALLVERCRIGEDDGFQMLLGGFEAIEASLENDGPESRNVLSASRVASTMAGAVPWSQLSGTSMRSPLRSHERSCGSAPPGLSPALSRTFKTFAIRSTE